MLYCSWKFNTALSVTDRTIRQKNRNIEDLKNTISHLYVIHFYGTLHPTEEHIYFSGAPWIVANNILCHEIRLTFEKIEILDFVF